MTYHVQIDPNKVPGDFRDKLLYREAVRLNSDGWIPAEFADESLHYLRELANSLPRRGIAFLGKAREFLTQLALDSISACNSTQVKELLDLEMRKEEAIQRSDFETAAELFARQRELGSRLNSSEIPLITKEQIVAALTRDGVSILADIRAKPNGDDYAHANDES